MKSVTLDVHTQPWTYVLGDSIRHDPPGGRSKTDKSVGDHLVHVPIRDRPLGLGLDIVHGPVSNLVVAAG